MRGGRSARAGPGRVGGEDPAGKEAGNALFAGGRNRLRSAGERYALPDVNSTENRPQH